MDKKQNRHTVIEFEDCEYVSFVDNAFIGGDSMSLKAKSSRNMFIHGNRYATEDQQVLVELRQQLAELRQKVATIEEEETRYQALATIAEMENNTGSNKAQLYQKCFELLKDHADLITTLTNLGTSLGL